MSELAKIKETSKNILSSMGFDIQCLEVKSLSGLSKKPVENKKRPKH